MEIIHGFIPYYAVLYNKVIYSVIITPPTQESHKPSIWHQNDRLWFILRVFRCQLHKRSGKCSVKHPSAKVLMLR